MDDQDFDEDIELEGEVDDWDGETPGLDWDESEARSILRDLGITSAL